MRYVGTVVRGIRTPIIKEDTDLVETVIDSLLKAAKNEEFEFRDRDIIAITEAVVGISEGNYVTVDDIGKDLSNKFKEKNVGLVFPILSRNRFSLILKGIARYMNKITILLSFPKDEVGNSIMNENILSVSPFNLDALITEDDYNQYFKDFVHPFTGINMVDYYRQLIQSENCEVEFVFSNNPQDILKYTNNVINCCIHSRYQVNKILKDNNALVYGLYEIMNKKIDDSGYNEEYGLLGSNKSTEERLKLFPRTGQFLVDTIQKRMKEITGKNIEVMVYGDGAFKDPVGQIWELADPVVSPAYTKGLIGTPNEIKLKYISDNLYDNLRGDDLSNAIKNEIKAKANNLTGEASSLGTTPRRYIDLIGSLCDLTSGSGDKGTPVVYIQGYFDNYADET